MRIIVFSGWLLCAVSAWGVELNIDFSGTTTGQTPTNFVSAVAGQGPAGNWTIMSDYVPPLLAPLTPQAEQLSSQPVLAQTSQDPTDERFPMLVYQPVTFKDFKLTARLKMVSGLVEEMAGVVFRYQNSSNFYVVRASALGRNVRFYKMVNGVRSDPIGPTVDVVPGKWYILTVQCTGNQITIWMNNTPMMPTLQDNTFNSGKVGFWTKSDAVSYFSDLKIEYTPEVPAAQMMVNHVLDLEDRILDLKLYTLDSQGVPRVLAGKNVKDVGQAGGPGEKAALAEGTVSFGRGPGTVAVWLPLRDRNGDPMAAVWIRLHSFFGETQDHAITRGTQIIKLMQDQVTSSEDLLK